MRISKIQLKILELKEINLRLVEACGASYVAGQAWRACISSESAPCQSIPEWPLRRFQRVFQGTFLTDETASPYVRRWKWFPSQGDEKGTR